MLISIPKTLSFRNVQIFSKFHKLTTKTMLSKVDRTIPSKYTYPLLSQVQLLSSSDQSSISTKETVPTSFKEKVQNLWSSYGYVAIGSYLGLYVVTLGSIFFCLDADLLHASTFGFNPESAVLKVCEIFESVTGSKSLPGFIREHPKVGTFAVAWVMTKFTEPIRMGVTLIAVPKISELLGKTRR